MKIIKSLILILAVSLISCSNDESIPMEKLLKEDYATLSMKQSGTSVNSNNVLNDIDQIKQFQSLIDGRSLNKIKQKDFKRLDDEIRTTEVTVISSYLLTSQDSSEMNGLTFTFLEDGRLMVIEIEKNIGVGFYIGLEISPELFKDIQEFYESRIHTGEVEKIDF